MYFNHKIGKALASAIKQHRKDSEDLFEKEEHSVVKQNTMDDSDLDSPTKNKLQDIISLTSQFTK